MHPTATRVFADPEARPHYARERTYDVRHIRLELELDERKRHLSGEATLWLSPINDGLRVVELDLSGTLHVDGVRQPGGRALAWEHRDDRLHIQLPREWAAGRELELAVAYHGTPRRGLYFVQPDATFRERPYQIWSQGQDEDSKFWFPCFDSPHDKATSEVLVTVRKPYRAISNGRLVAMRDHPRRGMRTFHWREEFPHPAYLLSLVVGDFEEVRDDADGVEVAYYVPRSAQPHVQRTFGRTPAMLRFFAHSLEYPYPFEKYAQVVVQDFIFGGMENITATTLTDGVLLDEVAAAETHSDGLIAHELAHQWWGNLVTCKEWSHAWLNEGFATYFDALFTEHHRGVDEFRWQMHGYAEEYFREDEEKYRRPIVERRWTRPIDLFDRHLYEKGALVLHMLRHELGDALFWKALRHYVRKHQFQNVESTDFKKAIEEATGRHLDAFFDQWVYSAGFPSLEVSWNWDSSARLVRLRVRQTQARDAASAFAFHLDVELGYSRGSERLRLELEQLEHTLYLPARERPLFVRIDPEHWILKKLQYEPGRAELLSQLEHAHDLFGQVDAARGLSRFVGDDGVREALQRAPARARFHAVKGELARALAQVGGAAARPVLFRGLADAEPRARRRFVTALAELRDDAEVVRRLRQLWEHEKSYSVRAEILRVLARQRAPGTATLCKRALRLSSFRDSIRAAALEALGELEEEQGIEIALRHARYGGSRWARDAAMKTLAALARLYPQRARMIQDTLEGYLVERSFFSNLSAAEALGKLGRSQAVPALRRLQRADVDARIQRASQIALEQLVSESRNPESWKSLQKEIRVLREENRELRERLDRLEGRLDGGSLGAARSHKQTSKNQR